METMRTGRVLPILFLILLLTRFAPGQSAQVRYEKIRDASAEYGPAGASVLKVAFEALSDGGYSRVGLEDLWVTALQEGKSLFGSQNMWAATGPVRTGDMLGQTTVGPWQLTVENAREYGKRHGIDPNWSGKQVAGYLEARPKLQAVLAADFIEESYRELGKRSPLAIQRYFWLEAFQRKEIGQGPWYASVLSADLEGRRTTGFYAKQILLGSRFNPRGLLYWLHITGDDPAVRETLSIWTQAGYPVSPEDIPHCSCPPAFQRYLLGLLEKP